MTQKRLEADYCVVGAGIAGLLIASRLARTGKRVLIVEQGPATSATTRAEVFRRATEQFDYSADYNDDLSADVLTPTRVVTPTGDKAVGRLFGTGGTALHFGGWMVRPLEQDLKTQTLFGVSRDWPLEYKDLEPWLTEAEYELGVPGTDDNRYAESRSKPFPMPAHAFSWFDKEIFGPAIKKLGMQAHSCPFAVTTQPYAYGGLAQRAACQGCRFCKACPTGARYSPDRVHGAWLDQQPNVGIENNLSLRYLETSPSGDRVVAAHAKRIPGHEDVVITAKQFVLSMGGAATTRALLLSNKNGAHKNGVGNNNSQIGRAFGDHFGSLAAFELDRDVGGRLGFTTMQCDHGRTNVDRRQEPGWILIGEPLGDVFPLHPIVTGWATRDDPISLSRLREMLPRIATFYAMHEYSDSGSFDLDPDKKDAFGDPIARMTLKPTAWDKRAGPTFEALMQRLGDEMKATENRHVTKEPFCAFGHPSGATAMADSPEDGVCDPNLKVFGVDNLHLCSVSTFPHMGANPPTLTIAALALRLASHLGGK